MVLRKTTQRKKVYFELSISINCFKINQVVIQFNLFTVKTLPILIGYEFNKKECLKLNFSNNCLLINQGDIQFNWIIAYALRLLFGVT
jgi:hypothetical protein